MTEKLLTGMLNHKKIKHNLFSYFFFLQVRVDRSGFIAYRVVSAENQVVEDVVRNSKFLQM